MSFKEAWIEIRRRGVWKVGIAYGAISWFLVYVATQVFPFFAVPNWGVRLVVVLFGLGFPVAMVLAWAFELTPTGMERREEVTLKSRDVTRKTDRRRRTIPTETRLWNLAGLLFDRKTRAQIYEPVINEIREDFLVARRDCRSPANYRWVRACFAIRGSLAFIRCLRIAIFRPVLALIPAKLKQLWKLFS